MTEAEVKADYLSKMGADLGEIYFALYKELTWLHARWLEYRKLFAEPDTIPLLNQNGRFVFKLVQDGLWEDTLLHISRLTDPAKSAGKENLSIQRLPGCISDATLKAEVQALVDVAVAKAEFAREHRNKRLAHSDLLHSGTPGAAQLSGISRKHVEEMLEALRNTMNRLELHFRNGSVAYQHFLATDGAEVLIRNLKKLGQKSAL